VLWQQGRTKESIAHYRAALNIEPNANLALQGLVWGLAENPGPGQSNPADAVESAQLACLNTKYKLPNFVDALIVSYARNRRSRCRRF
jgi:hypothetical protein